MMDYKLGDLLYRKQDPEYFYIVNIQYYKADVYERGKFSYHVTVAPPSEWKGSFYTDIFRED